MLAVVLLARPTPLKLARHTELRQMRVNADNDAKDQQRAEAAMSSIELRAQQQYARDLDVAQQTHARTSGTWVCSTIGRLTGCDALLRNQTAG